MVHCVGEAFLFMQFGLSMFEIEDTFCCEFDAPVPQRPPINESSHDCQLND